jgi:co-chaperonin GroES (HSP10)
MKIPYLPFGNELIVEPKQKKKRTASGLIIPDTAVQDDPIAIICRMGVNVNKDVDASEVLAIGDEIISLPQGNILLPDAEHWLITRDNVLCKVEKDG